MKEETFQKAQKLRSQISSVQSDLEFIRNLDIIKLTDTDRIAHHLDLTITPSQEVKKVCLKYYQSKLDKLKKEYEDL